MVSAILGKSVLDRTVVLGEMSVQGMLLKVAALPERMQAAVEAGAKRILIPSENKRDLAEVPDAILTAIQWQFYGLADEGGDPRDGDGLMRTALIRARTSADRVVKRVEAELWRGLRPAGPDLKIINPIIQDTKVHFMPFSRERMGITSGQD